jgi:peptide/nickel transport system permease protein
VLQYTIRRVLIAILTLWGITIVVFGIINLMPGDPAAIQADVQDPKVSARIYEMMVKQFDLDRPIHQRYFRWLWRTVQGDFGESFADGQPIGPKIRERLPNTMSVATLAVILSLLAAVPIGIVQAVRQDGWFDRVSSLVLYALFAIPSYVMAVLLIYFVGVQVDLLPFRGMTSDGFASLPPLEKAQDLAAHFTLITFCFTYTSVAFDSRFVRGNLLEVLRQDYVRTARAKGLSERVVVLKHAFRNTFIPLLTRLGFLVPALISGSVILEVIFTWPGLGRLFFDGILARDYPVMMASIVITSSLVLVGILLADLLYAWADPRISYE